MAIKRVSLLDYCLMIDAEFTDRDMRLIVEKIPRVLSCERGYYIAEKKEEALSHREYFRNKALPMLARANKIYKDYPEFFPSGQMELVYPRQ